MNHPRARAMSRLGHEVFARLSGGHRPRRLLNRDHECDVCRSGGKAQGNLNHAIDRGQAERYPRPVPHREHRPHDHRMSGLNLPLIRSNPGLQYCQPLQSREFHLWSDSGNLFRRHYLSLLLNLSGP